MSENFADDLIPDSEDNKDPIPEVEVELTDVPLDEEEFDEAREIRPLVLDAGPGQQRGDFRPKADYGTSVPKDFSVRVSAS